MHDPDDESAPTESGDLVAMWRWRMVVVEWIAKQTIEKKKELREGICAYIS